ncbi:MAG: CBS domain-containing protein [Planctomycetes bacterium]|nr:CBS domain-containing protein [Planctomycetota bacterium]
MILRDVLEKKSHEVHTISSHATVDEVVTELVRFNIGSLLVRDAPGGPILGIITERDILRAQAAHRAPLEQLLVASCMSRELITAQPEDDITVAMGLMTTHRVRHLPVVRDNELYGIVSIGDIVKAHHDELELNCYHMRSYIQGGASSVADLLA